MGVTFNRHLGPVESLLCGQYTLNTDSCRAAIKCALCGETWDLPPHCRVEPDGRVVPAIKCLSLACPFFEFVTLADHWLTDEECRR